jgi:hypothetical protein
MSIGGMAAGAASGSAGAKDLRILLSLEYICGNLACALHMRARGELSDGGAHGTLWRSREMLECLSIAREFDPDSFVSRVISPTIELLHSIVQ